MSLRYRIKRLIKSDINALVEGMEDPKWVLAQAIRDMEEELERMDGAITAKESHLLKLKEGVHHCQETLETLDPDIDFAIAEKREDIAKSLIRRQLVTRQNWEALLAEQKLCAEEHSKLQGRLRARQSSYEKVKARAQTLHLPQADEDLFQSAERLVPDDANLEHQVELELLRRLQGPKEVSDAKAH